MIRALSTTLAKGLMEAPMVMGRAMAISRAATGSASRRTLRSNLARIFGHLRR